jgi:TonB family protein
MDVVVEPRRSRRYRLPAWLAVAVAIHAGFALVAAWTRFDGFTSGAVNGRGGVSGAGAAADLDPACVLEEALAAAAHAGACLVPGVAVNGRDACFRESLAALETGRAACASASTPMEIAFVESAPSFKSSFEEEKEKELEEKKQEAEQEEEKFDDQDKVVDIARPEVETRPDDDTKLRAEYDSKVDKETIKRGQPVPSGNGVNGKDPSVRVASSTPSTESQQGARGGKEGVPGSTQAIAPQASSRGGGREASTEPGEAGAADGFEAMAGGNAAKRGRGLGIRIDPQEGQKATEGGEGGDGKPQSPDLRPSGDALARATSGSYDNLDDIDEGADTLLNTKRFKYASFFNRVKRAVWENWHADRVYALRDPDGKIYGVKDRLTVLKVSLRPDGSLANVIVERPCGVDFLDDEAVSAFRKAQPFPNPPRGLVDESSKLITFRFGFTLEIQDRPSWKIVRYQ